MSAHHKPPWWEDGDWFACENPERPFDYDHTMYGFPCTGCQVAAQAHCRIAGKASLSELFGMVPR